MLDDELLSLLAAFLEGLSVLNWIHLLSDADELNHLAVASKAIHSFLSRKNREDSERSPLLHNVGAKDTLERVAVDLLRILIKFAGSLRRSPDAIYTLIPPLCP